jgi:hypothetical protein
MNATRLFIVGSLLLPLAAGCSHVRDISDVPPYAKQVGVSYCLTSEAELLKEGTLLPSYSVVFERYRGSSDDWVVAKLPEGYPVKVESIKRVEGRTLIGDIPFKEEYAIVSLAHPKQSELRIQATLSLADFKKMRAADKRE